MAHRNSRSPALMSRSPLSSSRTFLPPSHYAAASGMSYTPRSPKTPVIRDRNTSSNFSYTVFAKDDDSEARRDNFKIMMPVSKPGPESSSSNSSFEYKPIGDPRFTVVSEPKSQPSKSNLREKRHSTMTGLPELEAQLLPSLRDTIDRMTRPPSRNLSSSSSHHEGVPLSNNLPPVPRNLEVLSSRTSNPSPCISQQSPRPFALSSVAHQKESPGFEATLPKTVLKSAMKSSTLKIFSSTTDLPPAPVNTEPSSLRSVKSLLGRSAPTTSKSNLSLSSGSFRKSLLKGIKSPDTFLGRNKPRVDLGISSATVKSPSASPSTASRDPQTSSAVQATAEAKTFTSNIPRPKNKIVPLSVTTDESDIEFRWEQDRRDGRKLTVTNAEAFTSSSSSEGEASYVPVEGKFSAGRFLPRDSAGPSSEFQQNAVGLGLNIRMNVGQYESHSDADSYHSWPRHNGPSSEQETSMRYSLTSSASAESLYSERVIPYQDKYYDAGSPEEIYQDADHRRRQADLVNIVTDMVPPSGPSRVTRYSMASDYCGEEGIAFSDSGDISDKPCDTSNNNDEYNSDDNYGYNFESSRSPKERPRSSSCMPTFLISEVDDNEYAPDEYTPYTPELRRPHSACDWTPPAQPSKLSPSNRMIQSQGRRSSPGSPAKTKIASLPKKFPKKPSWNASRVEHSAFSTYGSEWSDTKIDAGRKPKTNNPNVALPSHHSVAARERQAFGIPPSESDDIQRGSNQQYRLSHAESDLSSVGSSYWQENLDELSTGAETLFRKLSGGSAKQMQRRSYPVQERHNVRMSIISQTSSVSSSYEDQYEENEPGVAAERSTQACDMAKDRKYGQEHADIKPFKEITSPSPPWPSVDAGDRVRLLGQLFGTEEVFISRLNICVEMFVLPLRMENSRVWIAGVPQSVARLLDWFEDILNLHVQLYQLLQSCQERRQPMSSIISTFLSFVPRLEIYQPYLVRLADVTEEIVALMQNNKSDFGEFIRLQERSTAGEGWTLEKFLLEPVNRLAEYQNIISKIVNLTPREDPDFLLTFSLQRATDIVIRAMTEVKLREQDYDKLKRLRDCIKGWPSNFNLATRERRLVHQGTLNLCVLNPMPMSTKSVPAATQFLSRSKKLTDAISDWDVGHERSDSVKSSSTGGSFRSYGTSSSSASSNLPATPSLATRLPMSRLPVFKAARPDDSFSEDRTQHPRFRSLRMSSPNRGQVSLQVQVFVFSDIFVLATPIANMREQEWNLLDDIGISKAISCTEVSDTKQEEFFFDAEIIPTKPDKQGAVPENSIVAVRFSLPKQAPASFFDTSRTSNREDYENWMAAFRGCARSTLRSLSIPWLTNNIDFNSDPASDMRRAIDALISSGLPMPKSPSGQLPDLEELNLERSLVHEREERGWWSLRFQQTLRELHRQDDS